MISIISSMSEAGILQAKDLVQVNATMIVGILIFYTIPYIIKGGPSSRRESPHDTDVLYSIALAIALFAASAILAIVPIIPLFASEILTICGFIAITVAVIIFIKVIETAKYAIKEAKEERKARKTLTVEEFTPKTYEETQKEEAEKSKAENVVQKQDEELQKEEKVIEESKTFEVLPWKRPTREEDDDRSAYTRGS